MERSLKNLEAEALDLLQLHCPPTEVYYMPEVFGVLDDLVQAGKLRYYGVSVEKVEEALKAIEYPNVQSVQIIFNMFRQRPAELFFQRSQRRKVGILARVPLACGMLTGKLTPDQHFAADDHRLFNRHGEAFDRGETFSGVDYETGLAAVEELQALVPAGMTMAQFALRWILMFDAVTCAIPGAKRPARRRKTSPPPTCRPSAPRPWRRCGRSTTRGSARWCITTGRRRTQSPRLSPARELKRRPYPRSGRRKDDKTWRARATSCRLCRIYYLISRG